MLDHLPEGVERRTGPGFNNYKLADHLFVDDECVATIYHGGCNPHPNVKASGGDASRRHADILAYALRNDPRFPPHRVSRLDSATDRRGEGLYDRAQAVMHDVWREQRAHGCRLKDDRRGGSGPEDGRTYYIGSPSSPVRARLYEKGKEQLAKTGNPFWLDYLDLVRLELQVRPQKAFKGTAASMEPVEFWGCTGWSRQVAQGVLAMSAEPIQMRAPRQNDHEGRMRWLMQQGGPTLRDHLELMGSLEAFALDLARRLGVEADEESPQAA